MLHSVVRETEQQCRFSRGHKRSHLAVGKTQVSNSANWFCIDKHFGSESKRLHTRDKLLQLN